MTRDDIIAMAREAFDVELDGRGRGTFSTDSYGLERFAALVADAEREKAMQRCRYYLKHQCLPIIGSDDRTLYHDGVEDTAENIEVSILNMGNT